MAHSKQIVQNSIRANTEKHYQGCGPDSFTPLQKKQTQFETAPTSTISNYFSSPCSN